MLTDIAWYISSCTASVQAKVPCTLPSCKLMLLPTSQHPWSHLATDFITDLPESNGNMVIMVIINRFSKSLYLILLLGLPTAFQTAEPIFNNVFRIYGIPKDIVSD